MIYTCCVCVYVYLAVGHQQVSCYAVVIVAEQQLLGSLQNHHLQRLVFQRQESRSKISRLERRLRLNHWPQETAPLLPSGLVLFILLLFLFLACVFQGSDGVMVGAPVQSSPTSRFFLLLILGLLSHSFRLSLQPLYVAAERRQRLEGVVCDGLQGT